MWNVIVLIPDHCLSIYSIACRPKTVNVRLAGEHLHGKSLFTWLSLVMPLVASFCAVRFPTRCLGYDLGLN